ncbi:hypothetical protein MTsDn1_06820 [Alteromonas sp. MTD1]|uniref:hypothetical protein n=1 Tax=Alteromonas sp. MTD1 TaxID=3057962 RepID=UPI0036F2CDB5
MVLLKAVGAALVIFSLISAAWFLMVGGHDLAVGLPIGLLLAGILYLIKRDDEMR